MDTIPRYRTAKRSMAAPSQIHLYGMLESRSEAIAKKPIQNTVPQRAIGRGTEHRGVGSRRKEYGRCPTVQEFRKDSVLPSHSLFRQQVGQIPLQYWNTHHTDHAFLTSYRQQKWNDERICQAIEQFAALHGRLPKTTEFNSRNSLPSAGTVTKSTGYTVIQFLQQQYPSYLGGKQMVRQKEEFGMKMKW